MITKQRRTKSEVAAIRAAILEALRIDKPMTVRQIFYRLVSNGVIDKTENEYNHTVVRLLGEMRRDGTLPYWWIADNTRNQRKPKTFSEFEDALNHTANTYRRSVWDDQDAYLEVWLEKDALMGVLLDVTSRWDVPLMVSRGYPSISFLYGAAEAIGQVGKPTFLYYFGDHDPSGIDIPRFVEEGIRELAPRADITFERVAVNPEQIREFNLPTRPTKKSDNRAKNFDGESVEVDAIPPRQLRQIADRCIVRHIDQKAYTALQAIEAGERETLRTMYKWFKSENMTYEEREEKRWQVMQEMKAEAAHLLREEKEMLEGRGDDTPAS